MRYRGVLDRLKHMTYSRYQNLSICLLQFLQYFLKILQKMCCKGQISPSFTVIFKCLSIIMILHFALHIYKETDNRYDEHLAPC